MKKISLDSDWRFFKGNLEPANEVAGWGGAKAKAFDFGASAIDFDDSGWKPVDIPHDFVVEGDFVRKQEDFSGYGNIPAMETIDNRLVSGGSLEGGIVWYRKKFELGKEMEHKRIYLYFDGVYRDSIVFLNHYDIGKHASGYTPFCYDVTEFLNYGGVNLLAVRVDASGREGWWYEGGGIYRHVYLLAAEPVHFIPWGIFASASLVKEKGEYKTAHVHVETELRSRSLEKESIIWKTILLDRENNEVNSINSEVCLEPWEDRKLQQDLVIEFPHLWDISDPYRYQVNTVIYKKGVIIDSQITHLGVREIVFDKDAGFFLNGRKTKIKGVCVHQDHAGLGIDVPDRVWEFRLNKIKEMGGNAVRFSHNPPASEVLDQCDQMGILVMAETRKLSSSEENIRQLRDMVKRDRNHPSIIMWSIGNEEIHVQDKKEGGRLAVYMKMEVKRLDPTRPVTMAFCGWNGKPFHDPKVFLPVSEKLDVMGFNYMPEGWEEYHELKKEQPIIITEASTNSGTRGCYETDPVRSQYFILDLRNQGELVKKDKAELMWKKVSELEYISGIFLWTGFDYRGEPTPFSYPSVYSQFGIMDACGFPKDNFFYYQSWWSEKQVLHLFPTWNLPDKIGKAVSVYCYSNAEEVELFVNGVSQGKKIMEKNWYLEWENVIYQPGVLSAAGYWKDGRSITEEIKTTGAPAAVCLIPDKKELEGGGEDLTLITVEVTDESGMVVPESDALIRLELEGDGAILGVGNGNPGSHESDKMPMRRAFHGLCQVIVQAGKSRGRIGLRAYADGLCSGSCSITVK